MDEKIINFIKKQYPRDLRKQIVKTILKNEKNNNKHELENSYKIINQIFSYIINELNWTISKNNDTWDDTPLKIISEIFPKIQTTQWFKNQHINTTKSINVKNNVA